MRPARIWAAPSGLTDDFGIWRTEVQGNYSDGELYARADLADALAEALRMFVCHGCPVRHGDCASANSPVLCCPMQEATTTLAAYDAARKGEGA